MSRRLPPLRRVMHWVMATLLGLQFASAAAVNILDIWRRKRRKPYRFPTTPSRTVRAGDNELTIYTYGEDLYADMLKAIDQATSTIHFETFIWKADDTGQRFKDALIRAAERGVDVHVVFDDFANLVVKRSFLQLPAPITTYRHPALPRPWSPKHWGRDHRKILVVDSELGFVGGYNIGSLYATTWRDTHLGIRGPSVAEIDNAFIDFWNLHRRRHAPELPSSAARVWTGPLTVHRNSPRWQVYPIRNMYLEAIDKASQRIWLTHAYLIPDEDLIGALFAAVKRGVDVRIIVPATSNHVIVDWLSRGFYTALLRDGVRLFLYQGAMVHAKTATIDQTWSTIGTANLDRLSLWGNYEVNVEIIDEAVARAMEDIFTLDSSNTVELTLDAWERRSWVAKFTETILSPWRPLF